MGIVYRNKTVDWDEMYVVINFYNKKYETIKKKQYNKKNMNIMVVWKSVQPSA